MVFRPMWVSKSFDCNRVYRGADRSGDWQRRGAEEKLVNMVLGTIRRQIFQIEDFAHADADHRDDHPVPGLARDARFVGPDLAAPGVRADRSHVRAANPFGGLKAQAGGVTAGVAAPRAARQATLHVARADDDKIALADLDSLRRRAFFQLVVP